MASAPPAGPWQDFAGDTPAAPPPVAHEVGPWDDFKETAAAKPPTAEEAAKLYDFARHAKSPQELERFALNLRPDKSLSINNAAQILQFRDKNGGVVSHNVNFDGGSVASPETWGEWGSRQAGRFFSDVAGVGEGLASVIDVPTRAIGWALGKTGEMVGAPKHVTDQLENPKTIGGMIESTLPVPDDAAGRYTRQMARGAGGALAGSVGVGGAFSRAASPVAKRVGGVLMEQPGAQVAGGVAATTAAEGAKDVGGGPVAQTMAALAAGGTVGGITSRVGAYGGTAAPTAGQRVYEAAKRLGMEDKLLPADVGGTTTRAATSVSAMTLGGIPIAEQATKGVGALGAARDATAEAAGRVADATGAGQAAQSGARNFMATSERRATQLYDAIPVHPAKPAVLDSTKQALSDLNAGLQSNPELSALISDPRLMRFEDAIAGRSEQVPTGLLDASGKPIMRSVQKGGGLSWEDLKAFRTYVGEKAGQPSLQADISQQALRKLYAGLSEDLGATASAEGPKAVTAFNRANQYWRGRQDRIDNVLNAVLGNDLQKGSMQAFENVQRMGQAIGGDPIKMGRLMRSLSTDEADTVRATVIHRMGQAKAGAQDANGEVFSPAEFTTQWNKMDPRAKAVLFNRGDLRQSLDDIATVASGMKLGARFANTSKTALALNGAALLWKVFTNPVLAAGGAVAELSLGKALASPILARSLAKIGKAETPTATRAAIASLGGIAARASDPATRASASALQTHLMNAINDNITFGAAAASDKPGQDKQ